MLKQGKEREGEGGGQGEGGREGERELILN